MQPVKSATPHLVECYLNWTKLPPRARRQTSPYVAPPSTQRNYSSPGGHINVHYNVVGSDAVHNVSQDDNLNGVPDYVDSAASVFDNVWDTEVGVLGYNSPLNDPLQVYIDDLPNLFGYTALQNCQGSPLVCESFIVIDNDYDPGVYGIPWIHGLQVTAAHELFHSIQFGYDASEAAWLREATAVWVEDEVYDDVNDYLRYVRPWFNDTDVPLTTSDGIHEYGSVVYFKFLSEKYGLNFTKDVIERTPAFSGLNAVAAALPNSSLADVFEEFTTANLFPAAYYEEGAIYPELTISNTVSYAGFPLNLSGTVDNWAADYTVINSTVDDLFTSFSALDAAVVWRPALANTIGANHSVRAYPLNATQYGALNSSNSSAGRVVAIVANSGDSGSTGAYTLGIDSPPMRTVQAQEPGSNSTNYDGIVQFSYTPFFTHSQLANCSLHGNFSANFTANQTIPTPENARLNSFVLTLTNGTYLWRVRCIDDQAKIALTPNRTVEVSVRADQPGTTIVNASPSGETNVSAAYNLSIRLTVNESAQGHLTHSRLGFNPFNANFTHNPPGAYHRVELSAELERFLASLHMRLPYNPSELDQANLTEGNIGLYMYDRSVNAWLKQENATSGVFWVSQDETLDVISINTTRSGWYAIAQSNPSATYAVAPNWNLLSLYLMSP